MGFFDRLIVDLCDSLQSPLDDILARMIHWHSIVMARDQIGPGIIRINLEYLTVFEGSRRMVHEIQAELSSPNKHFHREGARGACTDGLRLSEYESPFVAPNHIPQRGRLVVLKDSKDARAVMNSLSVPSR